MKPIFSLLVLATVAIPGVKGEAVADFRWKKPFGSDGGPPAGFEAVCEGTGTFYARQHTLRDHMTPAPKGFMPWADALKPQFGGRPFPGSWEGDDAHGTLRTILVMDYEDVPVAVKDWIEEQSPAGAGLFGVYDKPAETEDGKEDEGGDVSGTSSSAVVKTTAPPRTSSQDTGEGRVMIFAPGALYEVLPLWVASGSSCEAQLMDLSAYNPEARDGGIIAWPIVHTTPNRRHDRREIHFIIKAQLLKKKESASAGTSSSAEEVTRDFGTASDKDEL